MAFTIKIEYQPKDIRIKKIEISPSWWNKDELLEIYNFKMRLNLTFMDYILIVDKIKLKEIVDHQKKYLGKGVYGFYDWKKNNDKTEIELDKLFNIIEDDFKINILIFEW